MPYQRHELPEGLQVLQPACRHLLSKGMYITGQRDPSQDGRAGDGNCWCGKTQHAVGPDQQMVARARCVPGRTCYEPLV